MIQNLNQLLRYVNSEKTISNINYKLIVKVLESEEEYVDMSPITSLYLNSLFS